MATFTNYATLSYTGGTTQSNTVTGELVETLSMTKTAVRGSYTPGDDVTYVLSIVNSGSAAMTGLTVTDDLGGYTYNNGTLYPLAYRTGSIRYYVNGTLQPAPTVTAGPPMTISGITIPAGGNALIVYEAATTAFTPLGTTATITNTATATGTGIVNGVTAQETIGMEARVSLRISKALNPVTVQENGQLTYTFVIGNSGTTAATATDQAVMTDTFDPRLSSITVTFNGTTWTAGVHYTYDPATGVFATLPGQITAPAATYTQNADGTWTVTPGTSTLVITGTV